MGKHLSKYSSESDYNNNKDTHLKPHISLITGSPKKMKYEKKVLTNLITFYIDDAEYQAEEGMTWEEWVNSDYNTIQYIICVDGYVRDPNMKMHALYIPGQSSATMGSGPRKNDIIENGQIYKNDTIGEPCMDGLIRPS